MEVLNNIRDSASNDKIYLMLDNAGIHKGEEVRKHMFSLNIQPIYNVAYKFEYMPNERLHSQLKSYFRKSLLRKMLDGADSKASPLKDALTETFITKHDEL